MTDLATIKQALQARGQSHLLRFWDELPQPQQEALLRQLAAIDFDLLDALADADINQSCPFVRTLDAIGRGMLSKSQTVALAIDRERLDAVCLDRLRRASRHLEIICGDELDDVFADNPIAAGGNDSCR